MALVVIETKIPNIDLPITIEVDNKRNSIKFSIVGSKVTGTKELQLENSNKTEG